MFVGSIEIYVSQIDMPNIFHATTESTTNGTTKDTKNISIDVLANDSSPNYSNESSSNSTMANNGVNTECKRVSISESVTVCNGDETGNHLNENANTRLSSGDQKDVVAGESGVVGGGTRENLAFTSALASPSCDSNQCSPSDLTSPMSSTSSAVAQTPLQENGDAWSMVSESGDTKSDSSAGMCLQIRK